MPLAVRSAPYGYIAVVFGQPSASADEDGMTRSSGGGPDASGTFGCLALYNYLRGGAELQLTAQWPLQQQRPPRWEGQRGASDTVSIRTVSEHDETTMSPPNPPMGSADLVPRTHRASR